VYEKEIVSDGGVAFATSPLAPAMRVRPPSRPSPRPESVYRVDTSALVVGGQEPKVRYLLREKRDGRRTYARTHRYGSAPRSSNASGSRWLLWTAGDSCVLHRARRLVVGSVVTPSSWPRNSGGGWAHGLRWWVGAWPPVVGGRMASGGGWAHGLRWWVGV
jgi:hypothetical protein